MESYGRTLLSAASPPRSIDRIASFLARRVDQGSRVVLVVVDGMSFAQWHQIRSASRLRVVQATGCLAMIPTLTTKLETGDTGRVAADRVCGVNPHNK